MDVLLRNITEMWFRLLLSILLFSGLYVSVTFMHCALMAEDIDTISFVFDSRMSLPDHVKSWLTSVNPFPTNWSTPFWSEHQKHSMANCSQMVVQWSQWTAFWMVPLLTPTTSCSPKLGYQMHLRDQFRDACCHLTTMARYQQAVCCAGCDN